MLGPCGALPDGGRCTAGNAGSQIEFLVGLHQELFRSAGVAAEVVVIVPLRLADAGKGLDERRLCRSKSGCWEGSMVADGACANAMALLTAIRTTEKREVCFMMVSLS